MDFKQKYTLLDPILGAGSRSFQGRQISTGREVTVHLLEGGTTPETQALLDRLRSLPPQCMSKLIEVGEADGARFVVTAAPPYLHLTAWLEEQERHQPPAQTFNKAGVWKVPAVRPAPVVTQSQAREPVVEPPLPPPPASEPVTPMPSMRDG